MKLLHHYPDQLWQLGDKSIPDPSFTPLRVFAQASLPSHPDCQTRLVCECSTAQAFRALGRLVVTRLVLKYVPTRVFQQEEAGDSNNKGASAESSAAEETGRVSANESAEPAASLLREEVPEEALQPATSPPKVEEATESSASMSQDELAQHCLLAGLHSVADNELPIMTSDFYSKHMLPAKPQGEI